MESTSSKSRTPSRCREWERNRRNKFNDAIVRLGEVVKEINSVSSGCKENENVQYPKIEIIEKAIICLTTCFKEKSQLKAEILALQIKIDAEKKQRENKKDASTQVFIGVTKKNKSDKVKVLMLKNTKRKALKEKTILTTNVKVSKDLKAISKQATVSGAAQATPPKPPFILPKLTSADKKGMENTILVLPATPYIFPQRSLILPTAPSAFLLLDDGQTLNKSIIPVKNRKNNDVTKTTMVNILPISAYSHPLSATNLKKNSTKSKFDGSKKTKKDKATNNIKELKSSTNNTPVKSSVSIGVLSKEEKKDNGTETDKPSEYKNTESIALNTDTCEVNVSKNNEMTIDVNIDNKNQRSQEIPKEAEVINTLKDVISKSTEMLEEDKRTLEKSPNVMVVENSNEKSNTKIPIEKETTDKDKENKLPNILDTTLCESTVDGGNARLELAEEFLAASPTAAFLMSFPLVSGNRADSPADETANALQVNSKDNNQRRNEIHSQPISYFEKPHTVDIKVKQTNKHNTSSNFVSKPSTENKHVDNTVSKVDTKTSTQTVTSNTTNDNPFLNLPMSSLPPTNSTVPDTSFSLDFDCTPSKTMASQTSYSNGNFFYKNDPFSTVKSSIYSTSNISSGHEFNSFSLYPCAMEKYTTKNKSDYSNVEENIMKIGSSRLTYDIDLGWSHKGFDFVSSTSASNTFNKDTIYTTATAPYSTSYNPFNPEFHVPLVSNSNKKDNIMKTSSSFPETIASFYSQPSTLWTEEVPFYTNNNNSSKSLTSRHQNYLSLDHVQSNVKLNISKQYDSKQISEPAITTVTKSLPNVNQHNISEKYNKKSSPNKTHINWMTSETRPMQANCNSTPTVLKDTQKSSYTQLDQLPKRQNYSDNSYFPISMHGFSTQTLTDDLQSWSSARPAGTTEISIEPPPINLPTLVGDLALGPHDKKKIDTSSRAAPHSDIQNCSNFFSVTQLMNRSSENNMQSRYQGLNVEAQKQVSVKPNITQNTNVASRKNMTRTESHVAQPCYVFNESKSPNSYENLFSHNKQKANKPDKNTKVQKNSYSAESLIRGGSQKHIDNNAKFVPSQKYNDFNGSQDSSIAQVSHFPAILDYSDNSYTGQQFSGTNLYNSSTNTSFYSNFMSGSSNLMSGNYTSGPFSGDFLDYNQTAECNYPNHKYTELKMRNNSIMFQQEKMPSTYKSSRRESTAKHKLECSKKESNKKCQLKRVKLSSDAEEWSDSSHMLWQNKTPTKRHSNLMPEELSFPNFVGNQVPNQYQPEFFNSHLVPANMQPVSHNVDRSVASFPVTSRANFNLSTIFPEITMKVQ